MSRLPARWVLSVVLLAAMAMFIARHVDWPRALASQNSQFELSAPRPGATTAQIPTVRVLSFPAPPHVLAIRGESSRANLKVLRTPDPGDAFRTLDASRLFDQDSDFDVTSSLPREPAQGQGCSGRCLNPHPGPFNWWYGVQRSQCEVEVWRQWSDGCRHVQLFNTCQQVWEPNVQWVCCVH
jgi:hypothetical protein